MPVFSLIRRAFAVIPCLGVAGCEVARPEATMRTGLETSAPSSFLPASAQLITVEETTSVMVGDAITEAIGNTRRGPVVFEVLTLSSGGQYGAYGAGFLRGWAENPVTRRPECDPVTGVSAGVSFSAVSYLGEGFGPLLDVFRGIGEAQVLTAFRMRSHRSVRLWRGQMPCQHRPNPLERRRYPARQSQ